MTGQWAERARCAGVDVNEMVPSVNPTEATIPAVRARAEELCAGCPVFARCAAAADAGREQGLWAGVWRTDGGRG